jgi:uncharacterized protein YpuA (DUF1002 family)
MKHILKKGLVLLFAGAMMLGTAFSAFADTASADSSYLSLGADLSDSEKSTVLKLLGVDEDALDDYTVLTVTNEEEHRYLDDYISQDQIGTMALSSVLVEKTEKGSGLNVKTYNISYCTEGMYTNALTTAGVTDADVTVAGPYEISGTAALIGAAKAFSESTGVSIDEKALDGALDEMITTGDLEAALDADPEAVEGLIAELKEKAAAGDIDLPSALGKSAQIGAMEIGDMRISGSGKKDGVRHGLRLLSGKIIVHQENCQTDKGSPSPSRLRRATSPKGRG